MLKHMLHSYYFCRVYLILLNEGKSISSNLCTPEAQFRPPQNSLCCPHFLYFLHMNRCYCYYHHCLHRCRHYPHRSSLLRHSKYTLIRRLLWIKIKVVVSNSRVIVGDELIGKGKYRDLLPIQLSVLICTLTSFYYSAHTLRFPGTIDMLPPYVLMKPGARTTSVK